MRNSSPPRFARLILEWLLPGSVESEFLIGDLDEEYRETIRRRRAPGKARLWYWKQVGKTLSASWTPVVGQRLPQHNQWRITPMGDLLREIAYAGRTLARNAGVSTLAIITLAVGIGATTAIFSVIQTVVLDPLPYPDSDRLVRVYEGHERFREQMGGRGLFSNLTFGTFAALHGNIQGLETSGGYRNWLFNITGEQAPERVTGALVSRGLLETIGVSPALGRFFEEEEFAGGAPAVILSYELWIRRYGGDPNVLGKPITLNESSATIVGVLPRGQAFPVNSQLWAPIPDTTSLWSNRTAHLLNMVGRLEDGTTLAEVQSELTALAVNLDRANPGVDPEPVLSVATQHERLTAGVREPLYVLLGAVACLLLIGCANVANLLSAQATARTPQLSIRAALGATRLRLIRQLILESSLLALAAGAVGILFAFLIIRAIQGFAPPDLPRIDGLAPSWEMSAVALGVAALTVLLFGLLPAVATSTPDLSQSLREGRQGSLARGVGRLRNLLVVGEVALAVLLLVGSGLLVNSFRKLLQEDPGFDPANMLVFQMYLSPGRFSEGGRAVEQYRYLTEALDSVRGLPGVEGVGLVNVAPLSGGPATGFYLTDQGEPADGEGNLAETRVVDPDYFEVMKIPLLAGRTFTSDDDESSAGVMMVSEEFATRYLGGTDGLGRRVTMTGWGPPLTAEVIGIVGDIKVSALEEAYRPAMYWHYPQFPQIFNTMVIRTSVEPRSLLSAVRERIWEINPDQTIAAVRTMEETLLGVTAQRRLILTLLGCFSLTSLVLAIVGLYGVLSYRVSLRLSEIGLRMALGASSRRVLGLVLRSGVGLCALGAVIGLIGAAGLSRVLSAQLYGISATDPATYAAITLLVFAISTAASLIPAMRAARVDPVQVIDR